MKLYFLKDFNEIDQFSIDIGQELSMILSDKLSDHRIPLIAEQHLHNIIENNSFNHDKYGLSYAFKNIGILFEPQLKIDFITLCKRYSRDSCLFIKHQGDIDNENLYFLTRQAGKKIDLTDLNYTIL
ncbi:MAG: hypothetical protein WD607_04615 [Candidatus Paceibacterota bacterium]